LTALNCIKKSKHQLKAFHSNEQAYKQINSAHLTKRKPMRKKIVFH